MTIVAEILDCMSGISKPQRKFFLTLVASMLVTGRRLNFVNLSRHSSLTEKTYRRHFHQAFAFTEFNQSVIARAVSHERTQLFAQDTSFSRKSGHHTYGLDHFWNGSAAKAEKGLEVSLISVVDVEANHCFALSAEQTPPQPAVKPCAQQSATRVDFYLEHLQRTAAFFPAAVKYGVFDGFYAKEKFVSGVCALNYQVICKLRADADLRYLYHGVQKKHGRCRKFDGKLTFNDLGRCQKVETDQAHLTLYTVVVWSLSLKRQVRVVIVVNTKDQVNSSIKST